MVRAAGLRGLPALIDDLGGDGRALFAAYGVAAALVDTDDAVIPSMVAGRLLETAAADRDCPDLGLRLAARQDTAILGPLAIAIENSATLGEALDCATRFLFVHSPALTIAQVADPSGRPGVVGLRYGSTEMDPMPPQVCDNGLGLLHRITVLLSGGRYGLRSVHLTHRPLAPVACMEWFRSRNRFRPGVHGRRARARSALQSTELRVGHKFRSPSHSGLSDSRRTCAEDHMRESAWQRGRRPIFPALLHPGRYQRRRASDERTRGSNRANPGSPRTSK